MFANRLMVIFLLPDLLSATSIAPKFSLHGTCKSCSPFIANTGHFTLSKNTAGFSFMKYCIQSSQIGKIQLKLGFLQEILFLQDYYNGPLYFKILHTQIIMGLRMPSAYTLERKY